MTELEQAIGALKAGRAVVFPTDTVYGLGVAVRFAESPQEVFQLKRRDQAKPIAWLVGSPDDLDRYGEDVPEEARERVRAQWPGALTVIVRASAEVPRAYQSASGTIGLRMPAGETALALIREAGPLATSSANVADQPAPRTFAEIDPVIKSAAAACIQDDRVGVGTASTVIDFTQGEPIVLRS